MIPKLDILFENGPERLLYAPHFVAPSTFESILQKADWKHNSITIYGKTHLEPRLTAWYGPAYKYSSIQWPATPFPNWLEPIRAELSQLLAFDFNSVLINYYRSGTDHMGWHRDNEKEMDDRCIAGITLGAARKMKFRNIHTKEQLEYLPETGSVLVMENFQRNWQHSIPKMLRVQEPRINLTFRKIKSL